MPKNKRRSASFFYINLTHIPKQRTLKYTLDSRVFGIYAVLQLT